MEITWVCFYTVGKYCMRRAALNIVMRTDTARCRRCFKALFSIPLRTGALQMDGQMDTYIHKHLNTSSDGWMNGQTVG
jgi:hypothetical protein